MDADSSRVVANYQIRQFLRTGSTLNVKAAQLQYANAQADFTLALSRFKELDVKDRGDRIRARLLSGQETPDAWLDDLDKRFTKATSRAMERFWYQLSKAAVTLIKAAMAELDIPSGQAKKLELAARLFMGASRCPLDIKSWWEKNREKVNFLHDVATWKPRSTDLESQEFKVGNLRVHNTIQLSGQALKQTQSVLEEAIKKIQMLHIPKGDAILYGDVFIVGQMKKAKTAAWYEPREDRIYVRPLKDHQLPSLIHEFGHRYFEKFIDPSARKKWITHHTELTYKTPSAEIKRPQPGDELPFEVTNAPDKKGIVDRIEGDRVYIKGVPTGYLSLMQLFRILHKVRAEYEFPTLYAARGGVEEHFCEAFSLAAIGKLDSFHLHAFLGIFQ